MLLSWVTEGAGRDWSGVLVLWCGWAVAVWVSGDVSGAEWKLSWELVGGGMRWWRRSAILSCGGG